MNLNWTEDGWNDYMYWQDLGQRKQIKRINKLIKDIKRHPFEGIGKPEPLRNELSGLWSRKIDSKNRIIYSYEEKGITIYSCKDHYYDH